MWTRAVVVGGSMAGLCAARVLADRFAEVLVLERDALPAGPRNRPGVPQGRHAHALLMVGARRLAGWLPGLQEELLAAGALTFDPGSDVYWYQAGGTRARCATGLPRALCSRALLEFVVRRRVRDLPNVDLRQIAVSGLVMSADGTAVTRVRTADGRAIDADLVVDASGRTCRASRWLSDAGYAPPPVSEVTIDMQYVTRQFLRRRDDPRDFRVGIVIGDGPGRRCGVAFALEHHRWMVTLAGFHGDRPPTDEEGWLDFARSLSSPVIADVAGSCEPLGGPVTHRLPSNLRRHVERWRPVPGGLVLLGDAVASFNPIYGQGMSSASAQAEALGAVLDRTRRLDAAFVRRYHRLAAHAVAAPWALSVGGDFSLPQTRGPRPRGHALASRYMRRVFRAAHTDEAVVRRLVEVTNLVRPPRALFTAGMLWRVLRPTPRPASSRPGEQVSGAPPSRVHGGRTPGAGAQVALHWASSGTTRGTRGSSASSPPVPPPSTGGARLGA